MPQGPYSRTNLWTGRTNSSIRTRKGGRPVKPFKSLQINLNRCRLAQDILIQNAWEMGVDVVIISEPYRQLPEWENDETGDASIWVTGFNGRFASTSRKVRAGGIVAVEIARVTIISCYCSPNKKTDFPKYLDDLEGVIKEAWSPGARIMVAGDLNAKAVAWGGGKSDKRGHLCMGLLGRQGLVPVRPKGKFSFMRNGGKSMIDVMAIDKCMASIHTRSTILPHPTESDHKYVLHTFAGMRPHLPGPLWAPYDIESLEPDRAWEEYDAERARIFNDSRTEAAEPIATSMQKALENVAGRILREKRLPRGSRKPNPWWTPEIAASRKAMHAARRMYQRKRKKMKSVPEIVEAKRAYSKTKKQLQIMIWRAKEGGWSELIDSVDSDPWGKPFKLVMAKIKGRQPRKALSMNRARGIAEGLFVTTPEERTDRYIGSLRRWVQTRDLRIKDGVTVDLVHEALAKLKPKKSPGLDRIPAELVLCLGKKYQEDIRELIWDSIKRGKVPAAWKTARVVLIPKPGKDPMGAGAYRPISILPMLSKVWEYAVKALLEREMGPDPFHQMQYGFRRGSGTIEACMEVVSFADECKAKNRLCALIAIDVKNAFNAIRWPVVLRELERRGISNALLGVMQDYLRDRRAIIHADDGIVDINVTAGVPQGSVLGPFLWNAVYDGVLEEVNRLRNTEAVAYADDLAILFTARDANQMESLMRNAMEVITRWFERTGLQIARDKTEIIFLRGNKSGNITSMYLFEETVPIKKEVRYLGVVLDSQRNFRPHLKGVIDRADIVVGALGKLLPNTRGPSQRSRVLYYTVWESILMYACPVWSPTLAIRARRDLIRRAQRAALIRTTTAYRTVSFHALCVLSGNMPIDVKAGMWREIFIRKDKDKRDPLYRGNIQTLKDREKTHRKAALESALSAWQEEWVGIPQSNWTRRLVNSVGTFSGENRKIFGMDYHTMQILTGHGAFQAFKERIGKARSDRCLDCREIVRDDAEHVLITCPTYEEQRRALKMIIGEDLNVDTVMECATKNEQTWAAFRRFSAETMRDREEKERILEKSAREERVRIRKEEMALRKRKRRRNRLTSAGKRKRNVQGTTGSKRQRIQRPDDGII